MGAALWLSQCRSLERLTGLPFTARHNGCNRLSRHGWQPSTVAICFALAVWLLLAWLAVAIRARWKGHAPVVAAKGLESISGLPWGLQELAEYRRESTGQLTGQTATVRAPGRLARLAYCTAHNRPLERAGMATAGKAATMPAGKREGLAARSKPACVALTGW